MAETESRERLVRLEVNQTYLIESQKRIESAIEKFLASQETKNAIFEASRQEVVLMKANAATTWKTVLAVGSVASTVGAAFSWIVGQFHLFDGVRRF